jgi:hypothetical protein
LVELAPETQIDPLRVAAGSKFGAAHRAAMPGGDLNAVTASWRLEAEKCGWRQPRLLDELAGLGSAGLWPGVRPGGPPKAEPGR